MVFALAGCEDGAVTAIDGDVGDRDGGVAVDGGSPLDSGSADRDASSATDAGPTGGTAGCGRAAELATDEWVERTIDVAGTARTWFVHLPAGYDPSRAYPVVYQFHGCSDQPTRENNNVPVERESGADAIHVRGRAVDSCWDTSPDGPDVAFFDALVAEVEATWCADTSRRFATGYSSGSFMTHRLGCIRGDVLRAVASIAGGQAGRSCAGTVAALLIHDRDDTTVNISASEGTRDAYVLANGCDATRTATDPSPCEAYDGCDPGLPVVWCETSGMSHARQDGLAAPAFWGFLSSF